MAPLPARTRFSYSLGSFVTGAFGTVPGLLLLPYLTDTLAVPAALASPIVTLPKAWDVLFNPIAGRLSDASLAKRGSRRWFLLVGGTGVAVLFALMFAHPDVGAVGVAATYVVVTFLLGATAYGLFQVPFNALPAELTDSPSERTTLTSWRIGFLAVAILVSGGGAPAITDGIGGVTGYRVMGLVIALVMLGGTLGVFFGLRDAPVGNRRQNTPGLRELVATMRQWRPFRWLLGVYFVQALGVGTVLAGISFYARYVLDDPGSRSTVFVAFVLPALLMMPVWPRVGARWGKLAGFRMASVVFGVALLCLLGGKVLPEAVIFVFAAVCGVGYAGISVFPLAILPDLITAEEDRTGETRAGIAAGVWTAGETLGLAFGGGLWAIILAVGGYVSSTDATANQPHSAILAILVGASVIPGVLIALALPLLRRSVLEPRHEPA
jgi:Na+/melibiose symporter-like transporter